MKLCFVTSPRGNYHMTELLAGLCSVTRDAGYEAELAHTGFPPVETDTAYVVIPHEYYGAEPTSEWPSPEQRARTVALCVENPGTPEFGSLCELVPHFPRALAINGSSLEALRERGVAVEHLQLGYTRHWDKWGGGERTRPIDITYLGSADPRRDALLAGFGRWLSRRRAAMLVPPLEHKPSPRPDYLVDDEKYAHLCNCKLLVNLHREASRSFEWCRALQAIANGCVVVSEPSIDHSPLVPGEHFVVAAAASIPHVVEPLLRDGDHLRALRTAAYEMIRSELDMDPVADQLVAAARELVENDSVRTLPQAGPPEPATAEAGHEPALPGPDASIRAALRQLSMDTLDLRRAVQRLVERSEGRDPDGMPERVAVTPAYLDARPRVSVAITVHDDGREVLDALASVAASDYEDYEVLVLDDASRDDSVQAVRDFFLRHPWMPGMLLHHRVNCGLGASRNALTGEARGELLFVLDVHNAIFPTTLARLVEALDRDPGATFAYPMIAVTRADEPLALRSQYAWDPEHFHHGNHIDALAMIRVDDLAALGGYTEDSRLSSWEAFHLWCACAESGRRGRLVQQVLAHYRDPGGQVLPWNRADPMEATSLMRVRFPTVVGSAQG